MNLAEPSKADSFTEIRCVLHKYCMCCSFFFLLLNFFSFYYFEISPRKAHTLNDDDEVMLVDGEWSEDCGSSSLW